MSRLAKMLPFIYFIIDLACIIAACLFILNVYHRPPETLDLFIYLTAFITVWVGFAYISELYTSNLHNRIAPRVKHYIKNHIYFIVLIALVKFTTPILEIFNVKQTGAFLLAFAIINICITFLAVTIISNFRRRKENTKDTLIIGVGDSALRITNYLKSNPDFGFVVYGYVTAKEEECKVDTSLVLAEFDNLESVLKTNSIHQIIIALPYKKSKTKKIKHIISVADHYGARISFVPDYQGLFGKDYQTIQDHQLDAVKIHTMPLDGTYPTLEKGIFDFLFAFFALLLLSPILLIVAVLIKFDSSGPVFYCPIRVGRGGKNFKLYKFRTMSDSDSEFGGTKSTQKDDPRITKLGRVLRKYNIDELPQFINVLLGDMSVVGPRPHRNYLNEKMKEQVDKYMIRHYFRPGITGWAQVNGWRGPTETEEQIMQRTAHDLWYLENWSFSLDLKIIWMTIFSTKALKNAY